MFPNEACDDRAQTGREQRKQAMSDDQERILIYWQYLALLGRNQQQPVSNAVREAELFEAKSQAGRECDVSEVDAHR